MAEKYKYRNTTNFNSLSDLSNSDLEKLDIYLDYKLHGGIS